jgi:hypothetical protein
MLLRNRLHTEIEIMKQLTHFLPGKSGRAWGRHVDRNREKEGFEQIAVAFLFKLQRSNDARQPIY